MRIVWDEPKRLAYFAKHGLDFADIWYFDWENAFIAPTYNNRFKAIGNFRGKGAVIIYAHMSKEALSIISFRPASAAERKNAYEAEIIKIIYPRARLHKRGLGRYRFSPCYG